VARFRSSLDSVDVALNRLRGQVARFGTDLSTTSNQLVLDRAAGVDQACTAGVAALRQISQLLVSEPFGGRSAAVQRDLTRAARSLSATLERCGHDWSAQPATTARADSLRAWGPYRSRALTEALRVYGERALAFRGETGTWKSPPH